MLNMTKIAVAIALIAGSATAGLASNENDGGNETGGFVLPPSMVGVNPVYHPEWFPRYSHGPEAYGYALDAYSYVPPGPPKRRVTHP
jgi:hypothetical protein